MEIPSNYSEQEVIDIIDNIANRLCYKFKFGYHTADDMKQEARVFAWQGLLEIAFIISKEIIILD
jgi:hypothetical protein